MMSDDILKKPQPRSVWILPICITFLILLFICIYRVYHIVLYMDFSLFFLIALEDLLLKIIEVRNLRMNKEKIRGFNNKFLKNSFLNLALAGVCLGWAVILKGDTVWMLIFGFLPLCVLPFIIIVEARALIANYRVKTVEDKNKI